MAIKLQGKRIAVEKIKMKSNGAHGGIIMPDSEEYLGYIRYVGIEANSIYQVGQKVYFSTNYQQSRIEGVDLCIMNDTEIFAIQE